MVWFCFAAFVGVRDAVLKTVFYITKTCSMISVGWRNFCDGALGGLPVATTFFLRTMTPTAPSVLFEVKIIF